MENNQQPNNAPVQGQSVGQEPPVAPTYVRIEEADTTMAQPVGEVYEGTTYAHTEHEPVQDVQATPVYDAAAPQAETVSAEAVTAPEQEAAQSFAAQPGQPSAAPTMPVQHPSGKTKRKNHGNFMKFVAVLLIGALVGGAAGGVVGYQLADGNSRALGTPQKVEQVATDGENLSVSDIAAHAMPAVVSVYNMANVNMNPFGGSFSGQPGTQAQGYGSGVLISADGLLVTNYHVIENSDSVMVTTEGDKEYEAKVLGTDPALDLAVLKIEGKDFPYVDIADSNKVRVGDLAVAIGNPLGSEFEDTVTDGIISGVDRKISSENGDLGLFQTNASINSGNSGGALLNGQAQLIGINSMKIQSSGMSSVEGMGFAIPSNVVLDFVNSVKDGSHTKNSTKKAWMGLTGYNMNESIARQLGTEQNTGILVAGVTEGGPAAQAGLQEADIVIKADGKTVETFDDLTDIIKSKQPGDTVELTVIRQGQTGTLTVTLGTQN